MGADEPGFETLWQATLERRPVSFGYRKVARVVEPWRLTSRNGAWYLVGFDRGRGEGRSFKLGRIEGEPVFAGRPDTVTLPAPEVVEAHVASLEARRDQTAIVAIREARRGS